jgi:phospho-N-acetylmuramoyl-pentapeptide-transferase
MLYYLSQYILEQSVGTSYEGKLTALRLFHYISFRTVGAAATSLLMSLFLGPSMIRWLKELSFGQSYADHAESASNLTARTNSKKGTPTMGGLLIVITLCVTTLLWTEWNTQIELTVLSVVVLAGLGFYDDYLKITKASRDGAKARIKLMVQIALAFFIGYYLWSIPATEKLITDIMIPFYKYPVIKGSAVAGLILTALTIVGSSNAVNLTDGLDGLAIGCTIIVSFVFLILTYLSSNLKFATYLQIPHVTGGGELTVFCAALCGSGLGFLWFNCHPAEVFMGDTGSLALGGALGIVAVLIHQPFALVIAGAIFVAEGASVILQKSWFRYTRIRYGTGRRIFLMAPLHHHFEKKNWHENKVVIRFYILCLLCALVALSSLKIR